MGTYLTGIGIISPLGHGRAETIDALRKNRTGIRPLTLFSVPHTPPLPVGEITGPLPDTIIPRTHQMALLAAQDVLAGVESLPDAVVIGVTTGGISKTEENLKSKTSASLDYQYHSPGSVTDLVARFCKCNGPVLTVSAACASGTAAIIIAAKLLQRGLAKTVLAGGADGLCRLTYHGFNSLQLIDSTGAHPFDRNRKGMSVAEGAAMVLLESADEIPETAMAEILGTGLSCDAYHETRPHPEGKGAVAAMTAAIEEAGLTPADIDYINLHGTGTIDNDLSEARAIHHIFGSRIPKLSSIKGATGHSLAASGAIETAISAMCLSENLIPANSGWRAVDPKLNLFPVPEPVTGKIDTILSNSFGFGGNNAALVIGTPRKTPPKIPRKTTGKRRQNPRSLVVAGSSCITGAGTTEDTMAAFLSGKSCQGILPDAIVSEHLPKKQIRRLKRLPRIGLSLASAALQAADPEESPSAVFFSTGWGSLSETDDFLMKLYQNNEKLSSPMDFIGSVHNAPAGQIAMMHGVTGPNITMTGGNYSFEQALIAASLLAPEKGLPVLAVGADEFHHRLSPLIDASVAKNPVMSDGGGALFLKTGDSGVRIRPTFYQLAGQSSTNVSSLINHLGGPENIQDRFGVILAGIPEAERFMAESQMDDFLSFSGIRMPVIDYRKTIGDFASASAVAVTIAVHLVGQGFIPGLLGSGNDLFLNDKGILVMGAGSVITAIEVFSS
jgi:3-oxoacyl-[acyl-carrier-protein] synthase-1/3-oxoacyl-[acyl-carrier-protein] synthase II